MEATTNSNNIYQRLLEVQKEAKAPRAKEGKFGLARSAEQILEAIKPVAQKHGVLIYTTDDMVLIGDRHKIVTVARAVNVDKPDEVVEAVASAWENTVDVNKFGQPILDTSQVSGKTGSYSKKYALQNLLAIDDTKDADFDEQGDHHTTTGAKPAKTQPTAPTGQQDTKPATSPASESTAPHWATCEIPGCKNKITPEGYAENKKYHDGHSICRQHSTNKDVPWKSLHPAYQSDVDDEALANEVLESLGAKEVV